MPEVKVGKVSDYFAHLMVAGIDLSSTLKMGDKIHIIGHTTNLELSVDSMQINRAAVTQAKAGDSIGIKVPERVRNGDSVYVVTD